MTERKPPPERFQVAFSFAGEERKLVRAIAEAVEKVLGAPNVFLDEWFEYYTAGADADSRIQEIYKTRSVLVVVCVSGHYGAKPWPLTEYEAIRARMMEGRVSGHDLSVLPIRVGDGEVKGLQFNTIAPDARSRTVAEMAQMILDRLSLLAAGVTQEELTSADWPDEPPKLHWPFADQGAARSAFERLLTRAAPWRLLPLRGPSESGKTQITRHMLGNALRVTDIACGRFDFKGTTDMDVEVRAFTQSLEISPPVASPRLNERLSNVLEALKRRRQPVLLIFDTYEAAKESREWVERLLLPNLIRATWLRVVIAGQETPKTTGMIWEAFASPPITLEPPKPADWLEYAKRHRSDLSLKDVKIAYRLARGKPTVLAQLLGPST